MKKKILLVGAIALFGFGAFFLSCSKPALGCSCSTTDNVSETDFEDDVTLALAGFLLDPAADCGDVEYRLENDYGYNNVKCK
jgi:predicted transcriptional regulator